MKDIKEYIVEGSNNFTLNDHERTALAELIGVMTGNIGEESDNDAYADLYRIFNDEEKEQLNDLYSFLDDRQTYKVANRSNMKADLKLLERIFKWIDDNDAWGDNYDLQDAYDKIMN